VRVCRRADCEEDDEEKGLEVEKCRHDGGSLKVEGSVACDPSLALE